MLRNGAAREGICGALIQKIQNTNLHESARMNTNSEKEILGFIRVDS